ncbi:MAG: alanine--tRNA ligase [Lentisphaerae bacterium GWF2_52_8]|nr:MAG: alanine--tRNA ligase [Lentisphaerae bacterium GWF2_52_8]
MQARELRKKYIEFFVSKGHAVIKSAPLVPDNDPTVLFTTAGMHPLVPFLLGEKHPLGKRLVNFQKCIRTGDIEEVGDPVHLTFFEMLGNWSLGDYFKKEAIEFSFEFLTSPKWLGIPLSRLAVTVFAGDADAPFDQEAYDLWLKLGVSEKRIAKCPKSDNWWGPAGQTGPCGPDTEMFYWTGEGSAPEIFDHKDRRWVEIWNDVFMQYNKTAEGRFEPLAQQNVDTGMGVERVAAVLQGKASCYETELFAPLFAKLDALRNLSSAPSLRCNSERIVVEHIRASTFMMADGVSPGNVDQSYVLRRLIRRAVREARKLGINGHFTAEMAKVVVDNYSDVYPELAASAARIAEEFTREEEQFAHALEKGVREFEKLIERVPAHIQNKVVSGKNAFHLYETYGFPLELTEEMAAEKGFKVDREGFNAAYEKHQELSRKGAEQKFKGGLADHSEDTALLHTATHLLHTALRKVLGEHVAQKGSNITAERLRFDFCHPDKMTDEQIATVEEIVNQAIKDNLSVTCKEASVEEARTEGAIGLFGDRYGERVKVYSIGSFSKEICGGPHAQNTGSLGRFKIQKEESSSRGVRRIKAVLEH